MRALRIGIGPAGTAVHLPAPAARSSPFHEAETAGKLISELQPLGFEITSPIGGTGFAARLEDGDGPTVLIRTDLDALPVREQTGREYAGTVKTTDDAGTEISVMHACGHDVHMATFIGVARALAAVKDQWKGTLLLIGQPAEERGAGARAMLADGLFARTAEPGRQVEPPRFDSCELENCR